MRLPWLAAPACRRRCRRARVCGWRRISRPVRHRHRARCESRSPDRARSTSSDCENAAKRGIPDRVGDSLAAAHRVDVDAVLVKENGDFVVWHAAAFREGDAAAQVCKPVGVAATTFVKLQVTDHKAATVLWGLSVRTVSEAATWRRNLRPLLALWTDEAGLLRRLRWLHG